MPVVQNIRQVTTMADANARRLKVEVVGAALEAHATAAKVRVDKLSLAVTEDAGFREALDCDLLLSCVDRPWARHVLNYIAYAYLIPVIDGGILIRTKNEKMRHASWRSHAVLPGKRCLMCIGQYDASLVNVERRGDLDDPSYIQRLPDDHPLKRNENVFPFSAHLAASQVMQMLHVALQPVGIADVGEQIYHFPDSSLDTTRGARCEPHCHFPGFVGRGDAIGLLITGSDLAAAKSREVPTASAPEVQTPRRWWHIFKRR